VKRVKLSETDASCLSNFLIGKGYNVKKPLENDVEVREERMIPNVQVVVKEIGDKDVLMGTDTSRLANKDKNGGEGDYVECTR